MYLHKRVASLSDFLYCPIPYKRLYINDYTNKHGYKKPCFYILFAVFHMSGDFTNHRFDEYFLYNNLSTYGCPKCGIKSAWKKRKNN